MSQQCKRERQLQEMRNTIVASVTQYICTNVNTKHNCETQMTKFTAMD